MPRLKRQQRLRGPGRTGVHRNDSSRRGTVKEERQVDRQMQFLPLRVGHLKVAQELHVPWDPSKARTLGTAEENRAGVAGANQPTAGWLDQMLMLRRQRG